MTLSDRWRELLNEFRRIDDRSLRIDVAAWSTGWTTYNVCGGDVPTSRGRYAAVAARAGALLAETQAVRLAAAAAAENDPLRRWCAYLADNYCRFVGTGSDADGAELAFGAVESATEAAELALQEIIAVVDAEGAGKLPAPEGADAPIEEWTAYRSPGEWQKWLDSHDRPASPTAWRKAKTHLGGEDHPVSGAKQVRFPVAKLLEDGLNPP